MEYIERFIEKDFKEWKDSANDYVLEVAGCRQVGKTTAVRHFAEQNYKNVIYVDVVSKDNTKILERVDEYNVEESLRSYCKLKGLDFTNDKDTVLILDEIQDSKALYERIRIFNRCLNCDVIVTGSYLQKTKNYFQPAGDLFCIRMYPLSFEEYLNYFGLYEYYCDSSVEQICAERYDDFKEVYDLYLRIGGYPSVFNAYLRGRSLDNAFEALINTFKSEFNVRITRGSDVDKIDQMFSAICDIICREKKGDSRIVDSLSKMTEQEVSKRISTKECNDLLAWMSAARLINYCDKVDLSTGRLYPSERFYFEDTGLFNYICEQNFIDSRSANGVLAETFIYKQLSENKFSKRFYRTRPSFAINASYELDFYVRSKIDDKVYGIEVKSGDSIGISISKMLEQHQIDFAVYAKGDCKCGVDEQKYILPVFLFNKFTFDKGGVVERAPLPKLTKDSFRPKSNR